MSDILALPADRIVTIADWRALPSEELWQSTLVHVIRITLEVVSAKVKESTSTLRRIVHTARRPEIVRHCSRAPALLRWMLSVAAVVRAFHVVATCANPRLASLSRRPLLPRGP